MARRLIMELRTTKVNGRKVDLRNADPKSTNDRSGGGQSQNRRYVS